MLYVNACWPTLVDMTAVPPPRRSDATRSRILRSARTEFAVAGYDRATIRGIAAGADIDPSLVMRYFGSKADLFDAIVEIDLRLPNLAKVPRRRLGETLVSHFLTRWEGDPADDALLTLLRSAATDENAANRMRGIFRHQLVPALVDIVSDPAEAATRGWSHCHSDARIGLVPTHRAASAGSRSGEGHANRVRRINDPAVRNGRPARA